MAVSIEAASWLAANIPCPTEIYYVLILLAVEKHTT